MEEQPSYHGRAQLLRRDWRLLIGCLFLGAFGMSMLYLAPQLKGGSAAALAVFSVMAVFASPFLLLYAWFANPRPLRKDGELIADEDGVYHDGRLILARKDIRAGFTFAREDGVTVQLARRFGRPVELIVPSAAEGRSVLRSLGLDASQSLATVPLRSLAAVDGRRLIPGLSLAGLVLGSPTTGMLTGSGTVAGIVAIASLLLFGLGVFMMAVKGKATIGTDGVLVTHLFRRRFYPYSNIARVLIAYHGFKTVVLVMKQGRPAHLPIPRDWTDKQEREAASRLVERIENAMAERGAAPGEAELAALARRGRPLSQWLEHLRSIGAGSNADHRSAPVPPDRLWRIVEDPALGAEERAAAAIALGSTNDAATRERLRAAARNTAAPKLRIALEAAAASEEEAEREALAVLERLTEDTEKRS